MGPRPDLRPEARFAVGQDVSCGDPTAPPCSHRRRVARVSRAFKQLGASQVVDIRFSCERNRWPRCGMSILL